MVRFSFLWLCHLHGIVIIFVDGPFFCRCNLGDQQAVAAKAASLAEGAAGAVASFNPGYFWMFTNCITSALFVLIRERELS